MSHPSIDKKKLILRAAMQLFSTKGSSATSMQEIAEACGMSKGSLYLHFKSKEELEQSLFDYCYQMLLDHLTQVELQQGLTPREKLWRQIIVMLELVLELREFLIMQFQDWHKNGTPYKEPASVKAHNSKLLRHGKNKLEAIYGPMIEPYTGDLLTIAYGMVGMYIRLLFEPHVSASPEQMASHLMDLLDLAAQHQLSNRPEPLISEEALRLMTEGAPGSLDLQQHPIIAVKRLRDHLSAITDADRQQEALETLQILEREILELRPRRAIIKGMLANLAAIPELAQHSADLKQLLQVYIQHT
ncbi:TetR/AcrR family transcriptional regulator [Paenibacillus phoenicis]|uniref:TetR/AcrR family transcriptional regulator n=1 Tax=Paenibacillus phoenicis TaxID=554117 RepID=A0ABU5PNH6_9BACL|nr:MULTISPECIES: TetR/AcrR family transcriptional regulator [Paenibacillus]EES74712.1 transcriptional regulator, TetR family [Paenibacillus sp. oral taxon 786 str. D14]MCT2195833.1 TetR/AcrR family transcriptional regulator [Paenibacillus sp. p3-SID1389]MEA3571431.1 TetR/AcrR family transcriptional regulator [Paenibacillus phoenicis]